MNIVIFSILLISLGLHALVYIRYLAGRIRSSLGLMLIFVLAFADVLLATSLVVPRSMEYGMLQFLAAAVVAGGTEFGAYKAQSIVSGGLAAYKGRPLPDEPSSSKQQSSSRHL